MKERTDILTALHTFCDDMDDEIQRLRGLVAELLPYMWTDVQSGLSLGSRPDGHECDPECEDCCWYRESVEWKNRMESGEFDEFTNG